MILINHLTQVAEFDGLRGWLIPTPTQFGYSTSAELFVFMSGYMVGLVYLSGPRPIRRIWRRAGTLWLYDIVLLAVIAPLMLVMSPAELGFWRLDVWFDHPVRSLLLFVTAQSGPRLLDVLQMYVLLMVLAPAAILIHRRSPVLMVAISLLLYLAAQLIALHRLLGVPGEEVGGWLKLMSWQALFYVPMALGAWRAHVGLFRWLEGNRIAFAVLLALYGAAAVAHAGPQFAVFEPRFGLHALRLAHAILALLLYASVLTLAVRWLGSAPFRAIGAVGRHSLDCFAFGVLLTYVMGTLWLRIGGGHPTYYLFEAGNVALTLLLANRLDAHRVDLSPAGEDASPAFRPAP